MANIIVLLPIYLPLKLQRGLAHVIDLGDVHLAYLVLLAFGHDFSHDFSF